jgi:excisionase family DNA binding protein
MPIDPQPRPSLVLVPHLLEVAHVAHRLSTSQEFVRRKIREGVLPALRMGARYRIEEADLLAYIAACKGAHKKPGDDRAGASDRRHTTAPAIILEHPRARDGS